MEYRKAKENEFKQIEKVLDHIGLGYPSQGNKNFWVAIDQNKIVGVVQTLEFDNFYFIANLGTHPDYRKKGIAKNLLHESTNKYKKDTYLYTVIPQYFERNGFKRTEYFKELPKRAIFDCSNCTPHICACMVKYAGFTNFPQI